MTDPTHEEIEAAAKIICCGSLPCGGCSPEQYARATKQARIALAAAIPLVREEYEPLQTDCQTQER